MSLPQDGTTNIPAAPVPTGNVPGPQLPAVQPLAAKRTFRGKDNVGKFGDTGKVNSSGLPQIINGLSNFGFFDQKQLTDNTFSPNTFAFYAILHLICSSMIGHDRFLKSVRLWHPLTVYLFYSVVFYIHILRIQRNAGRITAYHLTLLQGLENMFPAESIIIPGPLVAYFMGLTASSAPYEWFGDIYPRLPVMTKSPTQAGRYILPRLTDHSYDYVDFPNPLLFIDAIYRFAKGRLVRGLVTNNVGIAQPGDLYGIGTQLPANSVLAHDGSEAPFPFAFMHAIFTDRSTINVNGNIQFSRIDHNTTRKHYFNNTVYKLPLPESKRVNDQFYLNVHVNIAYYDVQVQQQPAINMSIMQSRLDNFTLDLPVRPSLDEGGTILLLEHLLGLTDLPDEANATLNIHNWFAQLIPDMTMFCRFIEDSRPLTSLPLIGLGAGHITWNVAPNPHLFVADPVVAAQDGETHYARRARLTVTSHVAHGSTSDPTLETVAERVSALGMSNQTWTAVAGNDAASQTARRSGPYWAQANMSISPAFDLGPYLGSEIGRYILPVAK